MQRYFMHLAYLGEPFHGWQRQPNAISVQQVIEDALATVMRQPVPIVGAGRTDAGVNAHSMVTHFDLPSPLTDTTPLIRALNNICGPAIAIYSITPVHAKAHARFDATSRTYRYFATTRKDPFTRTLAWQAPPALNFEAMNQAAEQLLSVSDFTSFAKLHTDNKTNICNVTHALWLPVVGHPHIMMFEITADRFLRNMVRAIVGTLVDVGRGKLSQTDFSHIIDQRNRCAAGTSMPAHALYLWDVTYPFYTTPTSSRTKE